ncbi:hypothetical protein OZX57_07245 [Bifidobacterium sp. ESL0682]|uniref:hypothetical protein n=1 Tax=Bifidobacterium sp. ESL0682 TaxID=2983212 RepID=UPI0023F70A1C|nr:hypothetical protein [Bifidobacterium sp. ESL0682]WEV41752.1 hypothetical protein OZX57_07245 [Bifidobacterium sp. ESL0682]
MRSLRNSSKNKAQLSPSDDNTSFDSTSPDDSASFDSTSSPFSSYDYTQQAPFSNDANDPGQNNAGANGNPPTNERGSQSQDGNNDNDIDVTPVPLTAKNFVIAIVAMIVIGALVLVFSHRSSSSNSTSSNNSGYSSYFDSRQKKLDAQEKESDIIDKALDVFHTEIFNPESQAVQAVYPVIESVGINAPSTTVNQADLDKLRSATAALGNSRNEFTKTEAYSQSQDVRETYKTYQDRKKNYVTVLNNFADAAVGYAATAKNCQENYASIPIMGEDPNYYANTQNMITNCLTSAQSIAQSKDPVIKKYATATVKRMGDAQKQLDALKALGSPDDIFGDHAKFLKSSPIEDKLRDDLYKAETYGNQNPLYKELTDARPDKEIEKIDTLLVDMSK